MTIVSSDAALADPLAGLRVGALRQATVTAGVGWAVFVGGSLLFTALQAITMPIAPGLRAAVRFAVSPAVLIWVAGVIAIGMIGGRRRAGLGGGSLVRWALGITPLATLLGIAIDFPETYSQPLLLFTPMGVLIVGWQWAGLFGAALVAAAAGWAVRRVDGGETSGKWRRRIVTTIALILVAVGGVATFALPTQWLQVDFRLGGQTQVSAADADRFVLTSWLAAGTLALAFVAALLAGRALRWLTGIALVLSLVAILLFQVPQGRLWPSAPDSEPYDTDYRPCYGTSGHCPGG